ncbi:MAG TPA: thioesterase family protein [Streptosporangiaceae bacterium]|jgi:acyl-CoA thioester hydrolase
MFERAVDVRWRDVDGLNHVNHAVFLTYLEEARDAFYAQIMGSEPIYVVVRLEVNFRAQVRYPDRRVTVRVEVVQLGTTSLTTRETILTPSGDVAADARVVTVRWDAGSHKPVPFTEAERARLTDESTS